MRMLVLVSALLLTLLPHDSTFAGPKASPDDIKSVREAGYFSLGTTGVGGMLNPAQEGMARLAVASDRDAAFTDIRTKGSLAGRMYLACYFSTFDVKQFRQVRRELESMGSETKLDIMKGSILSQQGIKEVLDRMSSGDCGTLLLAGTK